MSLKVWLPLTKDLRQQGIDGATVTNNSVTYSSTGGKLGGCYSFNSSSSAKLINNLKTNVTSAIGSLACWVKFNSFPTSSTWFNLMQVGSLGGFATCRLGIYMEYTNRINVSINGSTTNENAYTHSLSTNTWYHICATYDGTLVKLYIDGTEVMSKTATVGSYTTAAPYVYVGGTSNYYLNGYMNDVRYYDHALSPMEVKQLAQGLLLHYPLNRKGWGQENLATIASTNQYQWTAGSNFHYVWVNGGTLEPNTTYTFSAEVTVNNDVDRCTIFNYSPGDYTGTRNDYFPADGKRHSWTFTTSETAIGLIVYAGPAGQDANNTAIYKNIKIEKGNFATPYVPTTNETLYTLMNINGTTEYDCSGFENNSTKNMDTTYLSNTPKYNVSTFWGAVNTPKATLNDASILTSLTNCTISWWENCTTTGNTLLFSGQTQYYYIGAGNNSNPLYDYNIGTSGIILYKDGVAVNTSYDGQRVNHVGTYHIKDEWHHYVLTGINLSTWTTFIINGYSSWPLNAYVSDIRIYATALSADDVLSLYKNSHLS